MSAVVLLGGGGHCRSVIDVIEQTGIYSILGVLEKKVFLVPIFWVIHCSAAITICLHSSSKIVQL